MKQTMNTCDKTPGLSWKNRVEKGVDITVLKHEDSLVE